MKKVLIRLGAPGVTSTTKDSWGVKQMSIERNLGNMERMIRLALGGVLMWLAVTSPALNGIEWFVAIISVEV